MEKSSDNEADLTPVSGEREGKLIGVGRDRDCSTIPRMFCPGHWGFLRPKSATGVSGISLEWS